MPAGHAESCVRGEDIWLFAVGSSACPCTDGICGDADISARVRLVMLSAAQSGLPARVLSAAGSSPVGMLLCGIPRDALMLSVAVCAGVPGALLAGCVLRASAESSPPAALSGDAPWLTDDAPLSTYVASRRIGERGLVIARPLGPGFSNMHAMAVSEPPK